MIYGISDLHLDWTKEKDMGVFGPVWNDYENRIMDRWVSTVGPDDLVLVPGDISWAMTLNEARKDLERLDALPGTKAILRGNHDYWWTSLAKIQREAYASFRIVQNTCLVHDDIAICGTRGWSDPTSAGFTDQDAKVFAREQARLRLSLEAAPQGLEIWVMLHYPPFDRLGQPNALADICTAFGVTTCVYGHLHSEGLNGLVEGEVKGIKYHCISADHLNFQPKLLRGNL